MTPLFRAAMMACHWWASAAWASAANATTLAASARRSRAELVMSSQSRGRPSRCRHQTQTARLGDHPRHVGVPVELPDQVVLDARLDTDRPTQRDRMRLHRDVSAVVT